MGKVFLRFAPYERKRAEFKRFHEVGRSVPHRYNLLSFEPSREKRSHDLRVQENAFLFFIFVFCFFFLSFIFETIKLFFFFF